MIINPFWLFLRFSEDLVRPFHHINNNLCNALSAYELYILSNLVARCNTTCICQSCTIFVYSLKYRLVINWLLKEKYATSGAGTAYPSGATDFTGF